MSTRVLVVLATTVLLAIPGCMPESKPPEVTGPLDTETASKLLGRIRNANGPKFSVPHSFNGNEFTANWELGNTLKKNSQLQIKPPAEWSEGDLYQALEIVLNAHETKPWYGNLDDTVLRLMRAALKDDNNRAVGVAPDTPYDIAVKAKKHTKEWFLEVKVQILDENGMALGI